MIFSTKNHVTQTVYETPEPWKFQSSQGIPEDVRLNKAARQNWYRNKATDHNFYSCVEGVNPNMRVSKKVNPPQNLYGLTPDFDIKIPFETIVAAVNDMAVKPSWIGRSLGGGTHLIYLFERPICVGGDWKLAVELLDKAQHWLQLERLPGLDVPAFLDPGRYFCNGCDWKSAQHGPVPAAKVQSFFFEVVKGMKRPNAGVNIPIEVLQDALKEKYPSFDWPEEFTYESQGPSFWVPESTSTKSAILKKDGMFTFSAHAEKSFYGWSELLGSSFVRDYKDKTIGDAVSDIYFDGNKYWRKINKSWSACSHQEVELFLKVQQRIQTRGVDGDPSQMDETFNFLHNQNRIYNAGPFVLRKEGVIDDFMGKRVLNTSLYNVKQPAEGDQERGPDGNFPFLSQLFDGLFDPPEQLYHYLAWFKHAYANALVMNPQPGQNVFLMGGTGVGKTFASREVFGMSMGGYIDASDYLIHGSNFNSHYMEKPVWCIDDDTVSEDQRKQQKFATTIKKCTANEVHTYNQKFQVSGNVVWVGRIICTSNLDAISSQILGPLDESIQDKTSLFRCSGKPKFEFPSRQEIVKRTAKELPYFLKWLLDWTPPGYVKPNNRFGYESYQEPSLSAMSLQNSPAALLKEVLIIVFMSYFQLNPGADKWTGSLQSLLTLVGSTNPMGAETLRKMSHAAMLRYITLIEKERAVKIDTSVANSNVKNYTFYRNDFENE